MKRLLINSILLMVFMGLLLAPNYPYLKYLLVKPQTIVNNADVTVDNTQTLIGDIAYLTAIINRAGDKEAKTKKEAPAPEPNQTFNNLVYITPSTVEFPQPQHLQCKYTSDVQCFLSMVYIKIPLPPPELFA